MALGGPLGAIIGAGLGHTFVDQKTGFPGATAVLSTQERQQMVFFATVFAMLGKLAKADGRVSEEEIRVVEDFIRQRLSLDPRARDLAIRIFNEGKDNNVPFEQYARQFRDAFPRDERMRQMLYELLFTLALADGSLHPAEDRILQDALSDLDLDREVYDALRGRMAPDLAPLYTLLAIEESATDDEVKRAYRKAARDYHPDTLVSKGLPEEFQKFAEEKFKEVNRAYETIMEHRKSRA